MKRVPDKFNMLEGEKVPSDCSKIINGLFWNILNKAGKIGFI
jgi:hypothetical protein